MAKREIAMAGGGPKFSRRAKDVVFIKVGTGEHGYGEWNFWSEFDGVSSNGWMCPVKNGRPKRKENNTWVWEVGKKLTKGQERKEYEEAVRKMNSSSRPPIPAGSRGCNACGGNGWSCIDARKKCKVCKGKGYWTEEDILDYHKDCTEESCFG